MKYKRDIRFHYEIQSSLATLTKKWVSLSCSSLSVFYENQNNECPLTKFEQFSKINFGEICSQEGNCKQGSGKPHSPEATVRECFSK